jgi:predicted lipoprotein with Yx(FWY)xxD motif
VLAVVVVAGCGSSGSSNSGGGSGSTGSTSGSTGASTTASASGATLRATKGSLGLYLVDSQGRTLYLFEADKNGRSACSGECARDWPPLTVTGTAVAGNGVRTASLGTTKRSDGTTQVTYAGHPLYTFDEDTMAGQTRGEGLDLFGGEWYVVNPATGVKIDKHPVNNGGGY